MLTFLDRGVRLVATLMLLCAPLLAVAQQEDQPKIVIDNTRHDFGEIFEQPTYKHSFTVKNEGTADLEIKSVRPG